MSTNKAPDKIYINTEAATDLRYNPGEDDSKIEYIRKDALLEWANVHKTVIETNGEEDDAYTRGQYSVILALIDKLNSL